MKKQLQIAAALAAVMVVVVACTEKEIMDDFNRAKEEMPSSHLYRGYEEALSIAENAINLLDGETPTRATRKSARQIDLQTGVKYIIRKLTRGNAYAVDTLLYIFNYTDNQGFAVVSALAGTAGLLAVTESGHYDPETTSDDSVLPFIMQKMADYVIEEGIHDIPPLDTLRVPLTELKYEYDTVQYAIQPRLHTKWHQEGIFGIKFDNRQCGCANLAIAMVMHYFKYPATISLTYPGAPCNSITMDWNDVDHIIEGYISVDEGETAETKQNMGLLCRQIAQASNADLTKNPPSVSKTGLRNALLHYGFTASQYTDYFTNGILLNLTNQNLIVMTGYDASGGGHVWIADGSKYIKITETKWTRSEYDFDWQYRGEVVSSWVYNHFNWGYGGACNGYYYDKVFNSLSARSYDDPDKAKEVFAYDQDVKFMVIQH